MSVKAGRKLGSQITLRIAAGLAALAAISTAFGLLELISGSSQWWLVAAIFVGVPLGAIAAFLATLVTVTAPLVVRLIVAFMAAATVAATCTWLFDAVTPYTTLMMCEGLCDWEIRQQQHASATLALWIAFPLLVAAVSALYRARGSTLVKALLVVAFAIPVVQAFAIAGTAIMSSRRNQDASTAPAQHKH